MELQKVMKINTKLIIKHKADFQKGEPFPHLIIDDFLEQGFAKKLSTEFPEIDDTSLFRYDNPLEKKSALNDWNKFPKNTYSFFKYLCSDEVVKCLSQLVGVKLFADPGLHGGGWHLHKNGGKLNPHLDYNLHPKVGLQRKLNLIIYLPEEWKEEWGGHFGMWSHCEKIPEPKQLEKEVEIKFNRAVLFDTTHQSWHGLSRAVSSPNGEVRKSLAIYYLCKPPVGTENRERAFYAPDEKQKGDKKIEELIKRRADKLQYNTSYIVKED
ncbi:MAG: 2OG-Fe(II) oxygenase [Anditalea sp.]